MWGKSGFPGISMEQFYAVDEVRFLSRFAGYGEHGRGCIHGDDVPARSGKADADGDIARTGAEVNGLDATAHADPSSVVPM